MFYLNKIMNKLNILLKWISSIFLIIMLAITFVQVVMRYVFSKPFMWAEEVTLVILIWFGYLAISMVVQEDDHMSIEFLYNMFGKKAKLVFDVIKHLLMIGFSILMTKYGMQMTKNAYGKLLPASQMSRSILYIPITIAGILITLFSLMHLINLFIKSEPKEEVQ